MSTSSNGLPAGWAEATLGDAARPSRPRANPFDSPKDPFIGMEHVEAHSMKLLGSVPAGSMKSSAVRFEPGDVLYGRLRPYLNKVYRPDFRGLCSAEFIVFPDRPPLDGRFLQYRLNAADFVRFASSLNAGDRPRVDFDQLAPFPFRIPPLPEQRRIVAEIEQQFSRLDAGVAALKRVAANLKRYKAAVLKAACDGSLTADWRAAHPDAEPAGVLLKRILAERRRRWEQAERARMVARGKPPRDDRWKARYAEPQPPNPADLPPLPKTWTWATVEQLSSVIQYGSSAKCATEGDVPVLRMGNITTDGHIQVGELKYLPAKHDEFPELLLSPGDLLFNRTNSAELVGKSAVYRGEPAPCSFASYLIRVRLMDGAERAEPVYVAACLNSSLGRRWVKSVVSQQVGQANVNGTKLAAFTLPLPPHDEQLEIARRIDDSFSVAEHTVAEMDAAARRASHLRQSILRDAFAGKLVPQDPADEPAAALLERIRAGRADSAARPRRGPARPNRSSARPKRAAAGPKRSPSRP